MELWIPSLVSSWREFAREQTVIAKEKMTSRSKERVAAAFRRIFRGPTAERNESAGGSPMRVAAKNQGAPGTASNSPMSSPARRLIRCRDAVSPAASLDLAANPGTQITKKMFEYERLGFYFEYLYSLEVPLVFMLSIILIDAACV